MRGKPLTHISMVSIHGAKPVPLKSLPPDELEWVRQELLNSLNKWANEDFAEHPEDLSMFYEMTEENRERYLRDLAEVRGET